jgi:serine protease
MRSSHLCLIVVAVAAVCLVQPTFGADDIRVHPLATYSGPEYLPGQIIVQFRPGVSETVIAQLNEKNQAKVSYMSRLARFRVLTFPETIPPQAMVNIYANNPNVEYAELNHVRYAFGVPNDPYYSFQWHFDNAAYGGIDLARAWDLSTGSGVVVAVVDTGIRRGSDLMGTAFVAGHDFINNDEDPTDDNGHGTHVAGTIAQSTNNSIGVAGVAYGCTLMAVKVLNASGSGSDVTVADGVRWAADHGAKVINMSLGADAPSTTMEQAVNYAAGKGVTIVCASGNSASSAVSYPAAYPACIAVGATTYSEAVAWYSNGGSALDLTAPGGNNYADENGDTYADGVLQQTFDPATGAWSYYFYEGTSMATPHVSGVAALLIAQGTYTTPAAIQNRLQSTAEDKGATGWDSRYGWGIVNAYAALNGGTPPTLTAIAVTPAGATIQVGGTQQYTATGTYSDSSTKNISATATWNSSAPAVATISSPGLATGVSAGTTNISASVGTVASAPVALTVNPASATLVSIAVTPGTATINKGGTQTYTAMGTYSDDSTKDISWSVTWSSDNTDVATIDVVLSTAVATGVGAGTTHITAASGSISSNAATLTVNDVPAPGRVLLVDNMALRTQTRLTRKGTFVSAVADVWIVDGSGKPVRGVTVTGNWSGAVGGTTSKATNTSGLATLKSPEIKAPASGGLTFVLTITGVQKTGYTYDDGGNPPSGTTTWP